MLADSHPGFTSRPTGFAIKLFVAAAVTALVAACLGWVLYDSLQAARRQILQRESSIMLAVQDELSHSIEAVDQALLAAVHGSSTPGLAAMDDRTRQDVLFGTAAMLGTTEAILIADENGRVVYRSSTLSPVSLSVAGGPQFEAQRRSASAGVVVKAPKRSLGDGTWVVGLSRRISHPDGSFAGAALGRIGVSYFNAIFDRLQLAPGSSISLISTDGPLITRWPFSEQTVGHDMSASPLIHELNKAPSGSVEGPSDVDGVRRLYTYSKVPGLPFIVDVGFPTSQIYADWLGSSALLGSLLLVLVSISAVLIWTLWREYNRRGAAEAEARYREQQLHLLLENAENHATYLLDTAGRVQSWNPGAEKIKGYQAAEIIGRNYAAFFTAEDRARNEPERVLAFAAAYGHYKDEATRVRKDGSRFPARIAITAIRASNGELRGFAKVAHDLSGRQIEEQQRAIMIESTVTGMLIVNDAGIITLANSAADQIFGYPKGALIGQPVDNLVQEALRTSHASLRTAYTGGTGQRMVERQIRGLRKDGSLVSVEISLQRVSTGRDGVVVVSVVDATTRLQRAAEKAALDVAERRAVTDSNTRLEKLSRHLAQSRDQARQANEAKSRFLTGVTHELRTPLNGILGYAQLLSLEGGLSPVQSARVQAMQQAGEHLLGMINAVLDLSEIEADRIEIHSVVTDLPVLAQACLDVVKPAAQAKELRLSLEVDPAAQSSIVTDPVRLRQVIVNLLGNAVKFTRTGAVQLMLLPGCSAASLRLEVADTGPGIAAEHRSRLFKEFDRLDAALLSNAEGSGLGLAITARLVQRLHGQIGYTDNPGGGSIFWVELPLQEADDVTSAVPTTPISAPPAGSGALPVLVVADVAMNRDVAPALLRLAGHEVVCAEDGLAAIEASASNDFDAVLMDVRMPGMDGLEATRRIRSMPGPRGAVPIIAMTAQAFSDQIDQCMAAGMTGHVAKPFQHASLLAAITKAVASAPAMPRVVAAQAAAIAPEAPVLDQDSYHDFAILFDPHDVQRHLASLIERIERLVQALQAPGTLDHLPDLAEAAHACAGAAGALGFRQLASAAIAFERGSDSAPASVAELAESLIDAAGLALASGRSLMEVEAPVA